MRIVLFITICVLLGTSLAWGAATPSKPRLALSTAPLTVKGNGFKPRESIRLSVVASARTVRRTVNASLSGRFTATFPSVTVDRCNGGVTARAVGRRGSTAVAKLGPMPQCPPLP
jgi:hypothetical protein